MLSEIEKKTFKIKYPLYEYGASVMKEYMPKTYAAQMTDADEQFLSELKAFAKDPLDYLKLKQEYLISGFKTFFTECSRGADLEIEEYLNKKEMSKMRASSSISSREIENEINSIDNIIKENSIESFKDTYFPYLKDFGSTMIKLMMNDVCRMDYSQEDLVFLKNLNMITASDFELTALNQEFLEAGIKDYLSNCGGDTKTDMKKYLNKKDEEKKRMRKKKIEMKKFEEEQKKYYDNVNIEID